MARHRWPQAVSRSTSDPVSPPMPKPISVAAADHLIAVEAERDRYRQAITDAVTMLNERHTPQLRDQPGCLSCALRGHLTAALEGGA